MNPVLAWFAETKELQIAPETYKKWTSKPCNNSNIIKIFNVDCITAPTFSQAFRWFRENYDLFGVVEGKGYEHKRYYIYSINGKWHPSQPAIDTYEEAELACLKKLIEISKNK
jgi:hypothetical protein